MKVRFVPKNDDPLDPVNRMRCFDVMNALRDRGWDAALYLDEDEPFDVLVTLSLDFDLWLPVVTRLKAAGVKVVFDLSDNEFRRRAKLTRQRVLRTLPHLWNPREIFSRLLYFRHRQEFDVKIDAFVPECDMVTCSSKGICDDVAPLAPARRWVPDVIDTSFYSERKVHQAVGRDAKIVWVGMVSNCEFLDPVGPALARLQREHGMEVRVITDTGEPSLGRVLPRSLQCDYTLLHWSIDTIEGELLACDIGIGPYSGPLSKSANKIATYWALCLPVVASPLEDYVAVVRNGENGYIAQTDDEWRQALETLLMNPEERQRQGDTGRQLVLDQFSPEAVASMWRETLSDLVSGKA